MTHLLILDTEQADLLDAANQMMIAAMEARARRIDPDEWVSKTAQMTRAKCESVKAQLDLGPLPDWPNLSLERQLQVLTLCQAMTEAGNDQEKAIIYSGIRALILARDLVPDLPWHTPTDEAANLRGPQVEGDPEEPENQASNVRQAMRPDSD